jgi:predicted nucleotidyltransferase
MSFYVGNRDHVAWPTVELLAALRRTFLDRLRAGFRSWRPKPVHASLFGSAARGDGDATSDIDLLLIRPDEVSEDGPPWADHVDRIRQQVQGWAGNRCHVFQLDLPRLAEHVRAGAQRAAAAVRQARRLVHTAFGLELAAPSP